MFLIIFFRDKRSKLSQKWAYFKYLNKKIYTITPAKKGFIVFLIFKSDLFFEINVLKQNKVKNQNQHLLITDK